MIKHAQPNVVLLPNVDKTLLLVFIFILCTTGCYTILSPLSEYMPPEENQSINETVDSTIVTNKYINNYNYSNCTGYENSCSSIHWRYNSWTGTYYCDPYYYNFSSYNHHHNNHHHNDNYWWYSNNNWNNDNYSDNNSFTPPKKTKRNRSYSRNSSYSVDTYTSQESTQTNTSTSQENTQTNKSNNKKRRKHNRKPL